MNEILGYAFAIATSVIAGYLLTFLQPKSKLIYWMLHQFLFDVQPKPTDQFPNPPRAQLHTHSLTIQNMGRKAAEDIEIAHRQEPDVLKLLPSLNYSTSIAPSGEHIITVKSLASKEFFTMEYLSFTHYPELLYIRSKEAGHATPIAVQPQQIFPRTITTTAKLIYYTGFVTVIYWLIKLVIFLYSLLAPVKIFGAILLLPMNLMFHTMFSELI